MGAFAVMGLDEITQSAVQRFQNQHIGGSEFRRPIKEVLGITLWVKKRDMGEILPNCFPKGSFVSS